MRGPDRDCALVPHRQLPLAQIHRRRGFDLHHPVQVIGLVVASLLALKHCPTRHPRCQGRFGNKVSEETVSALSGHSSSASITFTHAPPPCAS